MANTTGQSEGQKYQNRSDINRVVLTDQFNMQYDPNRVNEPMYMGGLQPQQIRHDGVYNQIQPPIVINRYIIERPLVRQPLPHMEPERVPQKQIKPATKKPMVKEKDTWNTLFGD